MILRSGHRNGDHSLVVMDIGDTNGDTNGDAVVTAVVIAVVVAVAVVT